VKSAGREERRSGGPRLQPDPIVDCMVEALLNTINSATQCSVILPPNVQSIIHAEGVRCGGCGSIKTMSGSKSGE
jgi:hypothetical protein